MAEALFFTCDVCGHRYQHGQHRYEGHALMLYGEIFACDPCWKGNHDGWAPHFERRLLEHLARQALPEPVRNSQGRLPRN
jgi:hypothetical protein